MVIALDIKQAVRLAIERHPGPDMAIEALDLAEAVGLPRTKSSTRDLQYIIAELVKNDHVPICSSCSSKHPGYYVPETPEQGYPFERQLTSRAIETFKHRRDFRVAMKMYFAPGYQRKLL